MGARRAVQIARLGVLMSSIFAAELDRFGDRIEELIAQVAAEKMQVIIEDLAEDHIPAVLDQKVDQKVEGAFEDFDLPGAILRKIEAVDIQALVSNAIQKTLVRLLEEQLRGMIQKQVHAALMSDEIRNLIIDQTDVRARALMESPEMTKKLEELVKEGMSSTLQRWTTTLVQGLALAPRKNQRRAVAAPRVKGGTQPPNRSP